MHLSEETDESDSADFETFRMSNGKRFNSDSEDNSNVYVASHKNPGDQSSGYIQDDLQVIADDKLPDYIQKDSQVIDDEDSINDDSQIIADDKLPDSLKDDSHEIVDRIVDGFNAMLAHK